MSPFEPTKEPVTRRRFMRGVVAAAATIAGAPILSACSSAAPAAPAATAKPTAAASTSVPAAAAAPTVSSAAAAKKISVKFAIVTGPTHPYAQGYTHFFKEVTARTKGQVEFQVFENGQLGTGKDNLEAIRSGALEMHLSASEIAQFVPEWDATSLYFLFRDDAHAYRAADGEVGQILGKKLEAQGFKVLGYWNAGTRHIFSRANKKIQKIDDMKGLKIRVIQNKLYVDSFNALGALSTPIASTEVYNALQQGVIDAAENDPTTILDQKWYEPAKNLALTAHQLDGMGRPFLVAPKFFNELPADIQKVFVEVGKEATEVERKAIEDGQKKGLDTLREKGMQINEVDREPFMKIMQDKIYPTMQGETSELVKKILAL